MARVDIAVFPNRAHISLADLGVAGFAGQLPLVVGVHFLFLCQRRGVMDDVLETMCRPGVELRMLYNFIERIQETHCRRVDFRLG